MRFESICTKDVSLFPWYTVLDEEIVYSKNREALNYAWRESFVLPIHSMNLTSDFNDVNNQFIGYVKRNPKLF